jgi:hypothetical protein
MPILDRICRVFSKTAKEFGLNSVLKDAFLVSLAFLIEKRDLAVSFFSFFFSFFWGNEAFFFSFSHFWYSKWQFLNDFIYKNRRNRRPKYAKMSLFRRFPPKIENLSYVEACFFLVVFLWLFFYFFDF